ncbi:MAG: hypothetical protein GXP32_08315, partial [Kiritimatiellaeota bacterium]|nr:hypothetical protein [Kiritimatiellota bacterium]
MMNTKSQKGLALLLMLAFIPRVAAGQTVSQRPQKLMQIPQMNKLIANIHSDLKSLCKKYDWMSEYSDKNIFGKRFIFYMSKKREKKDLL